MRRICRFCGIVLCSAVILSLTAVAASGGQVSGKSTLKLIGDRTINGPVITAETKAAGPVDVFYNNSEKSPAAEERTEEHAVMQRVYENTGVDLAGMSFVPFEYLWLRNGEELDPQYEPLKTFLIDEFILAGEGEGLPSGVYYDGSNAYLVRSLGGAKIRLVHSRIGDGAIPSADGAAAMDGADSERVFNGRTYSLAGVYDIE